MKYYLLLFFFTYVMVTMAVPYWRVKRATGQNAFIVPRDDSAQGFIGRIFKLLFGLAFVVLSVNAFAPQWTAFLLPADFLAKPGIWWVGMALLHLSLFLVVVAQVQMNRSWRVGFDENQRTELVTGGLFRYSRNPVFVGMLLTMLGLFLVLPNALTLLAAALTWVILQIQVRMEEEYLTKTHGNFYLGYMKKTGRWF